MTGRRDHATMILTSNKRGANAMSDANQSPQGNQNGREPTRPLSEIGHLFLSSIRDRQTNGAARPIRKGPGQSESAQSDSPKIDPKVSIDLTPEEFAQVYGQAEAEENADPRPHVSAVIATHLNGRQVDRTREYAAHLASSCGRVGLIEIDAAEFRVTLFERHPEGMETTQNSSAATPMPFEAKRMCEALEELSWDVDRWLLLMPNPRTTECRALLAQVQQWTLLATCDHDGMVSCYRTLKGLLGEKKINERQQISQPQISQPQMSLALLDVRSLDEADRVTLKLASVCDQFLNSKLESESVVKPAPQVASHPVVCCRASRESVGMPQFDVVRDFITRSAPETVVVETRSQPAPLTPTVEVKMPEIAASLPLPIPMPAAKPGLASPVIPPVIPPMIPPMIAPVTLDAEVLDLVGEEANPIAVVSAFIKGPGGLIDTPIKAPMCPDASLAVARDRKMVLVAVASEGLCDLHAIGSAYRWLCENRSLIAMALPQFAIEATAAPRLQLLVDQTDLRADILQPLLKSENVTVQTYRKLRWGGKTGLLLEAA